MSHYPVCVLGIQRAGSRSHESWRTFSPACRRRWWCHSDWTNSPQGTDSHLLSHCCCLCATNSWFNSWTCEINTNTNESRELRTTHGAVACVWWTHCHLPCRQVDVGTDLRTTEHGGNMPHCRLCVASESIKYQWQLRARCRNARLTTQLANWQLTLTGRLTRCRVARSSVNWPFG